MPKIAPRINILFKLFLFYSHKPSISKVDDAWNALMKWALNNNKDNVAYTLTAYPCSISMTRNTLILVVFSKCFPPHHNKIKSWFIVTYKLFPLTRGNGNVQVTVRRGVSPILLIGNVAFLAFSYGCWKGKKQGFSKIPYYNHMNFKEDITCTHSRIS